MVGLDWLLRCEGRWHGTNRLQVSEAEPVEESASTVTIAPILGGRFVRVDQTWSYRGKPQEGSLLIGYQSDLQMATAQWIDTWHMGDKVMDLRGQTHGNDGLEVRGAYAAPPGPDWGWRIRIQPGGEELTITMFNVEPDGKEQWAVQSKYSRA